MPVDQPTDSEVASPEKLTPAVAVACLVASGSCCDVLLAVESCPQDKVYAGPYCWTCSSGYSTGS